MRVGMAKKRWIVMSQNAAEHPVFYHCISRVVDRKLVFGVHALHVMQNGGN